jgi:toxin ParE1/3/4
MDGARQFGIAQADAYHDGLERLFDRLALYPEMARERHELNPPVRVQPYGTHIVIYCIGRDGIDILRVRHGRENWLSNEFGDDG